MDPLSVVKNYDSKAVTSGTKDKINVELQRYNKTKTMQNHYGTLFDSVHLKSKGEYNTYCVGSYTDILNFHHHSILQFMNKDFSISNLSYMFYATNIKLYLSNWNRYIMQMKILKKNKIFQHS